MGAITVPLRRIILDLRKATKTPIKTKACLKNAFRVLINDSF